MLLMAACHSVSISTHGPHHPTNRNRQTNPNPQNDSAPTNSAKRSIIPTKKMMTNQWFLRQEASMIAHQHAAGSSSSPDALTTPLHPIPPIPYPTIPHSYKNTPIPNHTTTQPQILSCPPPKSWGKKKKKIPNPPNPPNLQNPQNPLFELQRKGEEYKTPNSKMASGALLLPKLSMAFVAFTILCSASFALMADAVSLATGPAAAAAPTAPAAAAPSPGSLNLTAILEKAGAFNTYISLLKSTQVGNQLQTQLNNSQQGITIFAPSDTAFSALKPGTLNSISDQDKIALLQYHALPNYYTFGQFQTVSNPVRTMASGNGGPFGINFTSIGNSVNVSTGLVNVAVSGAVYSQNPVAVYQVDKVLLPQDIFGPKPPAAAPAPDAGAPIVAPGVSPSSDGSGAATSGCRSRFVGFSGLLAMAAIAVGFVGVGL